MSESNSSLDALLKRARTAGDGLQAATDELNGSLMMAEHALAELKLGMSASVTIDTDDDGPHYRALAFARDGRAWRLSVWYIDGFTEIIDDSKHILNAPRELRVRAAAALPELFEALITAVEGQTAEVRHSADTAAGFANALQGTPRVVRK